MDLKHKHKNGRRFSSSRERMKLYEAWHLELRAEGPLSPEGLTLASQSPSCTQQTPSHGPSLNAQARAGFSQPVHPLDASPEMLMDLLPTKWGRYITSRVRMKELYYVAKARQTELRNEVSLRFGLSLNPQQPLELDSVSVVLESLKHALDMHAREHYLECLQLYSSFATEYDHYVVEWYEAFNLGDERLLHKLRKARKAYIASQAGLSPRECWPELPSCRTHLWRQRYRPFIGMCSQRPPPPIQSHPSKSQSFRRMLSQRSLKPFLHPSARWKSSTQVL
jgi:hypothetical protein